MGEIFQVVVPPPRPGWGARPPPMPNSVRRQSVLDCAKSRMAASLTLLVLGLGTRPTRVARTVGVSNRDQMVLASALESFTHTQWEVMDDAADGVGESYRLAVCEGLCDLDTQYLAEVLDESDAVDPILILPEEAAEAWSHPISVEQAAGLLRWHEERWGLRVPIAAPSPASAASTVARRARLAAHVLIDGAPRPGHEEPDVSSVLVVDGLVDETLRRDLLALLQGDRLGCGAVPEVERDGEEDGPDPASWRRCLVDRDDDAEAEATWALRPAALSRLCPMPGTRQPPAVLQFQEALSELLSHVDVCFAPPPFTGLPITNDDATPSADAEGEPLELDGTLGGSTPIVANAPTSADEGRFKIHIDGDPLTVPNSPWVDLHGRFPNRSPGYPRLVSCIAYLNERWDGARWGGETTFIDPPTGREVRVRPRPGRVVLMDQDVQHRIEPPRAAAGPARARYSLVWKLCLHPKNDVSQGSAGEGLCCGKRVLSLCPPSWDTTGSLAGAVDQGAICIGSAAALLGTPCASASLGPSAGATAAAVEPASDVDEDPCASDDVWRGESLRATVVIG